MKPIADSLPSAVYSSAQVRVLDRIAIEQLGIPSFELMTRAAQAAFDALRGRWPAARALTIVCGAGNNAGDGYVLARLARLHGLDVRVAAVAEPERLRGDAAAAWSQARAAGVAIGAWPSGLEPAFGADVVVDALLGTGLARELDPAYAAAVRSINDSHRPILALDVPSGLDADTGWPRGDAVRADLTITFVGLKQGLFLGAAPDYCGELAFAGLQIPESAAQTLAPVMSRLSIEGLTHALPRRPRTSHKAANGRLLLVGGGPGMPGAIRLAAEAALRAGAGLAYVATHPANVVTVMAGRPEIICRGVEQPAEIDGLIEQADAIVVGPGLGQTAWALALWQRLAREPRPSVVDADALNLLARQPFERSAWVLTPHPGEAARLLATDAREIELDRHGRAIDLARRFGATVILKGARSLIADLDDTHQVSVAVCDRGNPGMATAGTGDVLAGVVGALLAQGRNTGEAARAGVLLHALAGDDAAADGERGLIASDLLAFIRRRANPH
jgi:NAD(P)H-hydrate epimerase